MSTGPPPNLTPEQPPGDEHRSAAMIRSIAAHPIDMARLMDELHRPVIDEDSLIDLVHRSSREAVRILSGVDWAGVTAQFAGAPFTAAHSEHRVLVVDEGQYGQGDGPCLQAMQTGRAVTMTSEEVTERWPVLDRAVQAAGVRSFHAEPLHAGTRTVGCLNLYGAKPGTLTPDPDLLSVITEYLDRGLTDYSAAQPAAADANQLQEMLRTRLRLNQAVGVLMAVHGVDSTTAQNLLDQQAIDHSSTLIDAALTVIALHTPTGDPLAE
jgi:hypothetical protein